MRYPLLFAVLIMACSGCSKETNDFANANPDYNHNRSVGASSNDLLSNTTYNSLEIEVLYMPGYLPSADSRDHLVAFIQTHLKKTNIIYTPREIASSGSASMNIQQIRELENKERKLFTGGSTMRLTLIVTDGAYSEAGVLGVAYRNTSMVLMGGTIHSNSGAIGQASRVKLESTVLEHELGHLLGLVDLGSPMVTAHKDATHGNHCNNDKCLMYYAAETTDALGFLITGNVPPLDTNCSNDLKGNGGK